MSMAIQELFILFQIPSRPTLALLTLRATEIRTTEYIIELILLSKFGNLK